MEIYLTNVFFFFRRKLLKIIMKAFVFFFCTIVFSMTPIDILSQNSKIRIDADREATVDEVFDLIMNQTDYVFIYQVDMFKGAPKVKLEKGVIKTNDLLKNALSWDLFNYELVGKKMVVIKKGVNELGVAQEIIKGKVTDMSNLPLPGVSIIVNEGEKGTTSDFDGNFSIQASKGDIITFSFLGFISQEIVFNEQDSINVILKEDVNVLDEVVLVSSGYQKISKERATGAFESVSKDQLEKPASTISERLVGMVAGLQSTVRADGSVDFEIRGQSSLFADQQPLLVVDGFPIEGGFETINPNDVESVTVLKDAAAASIWGAKSGNGVIVVTTKRAKKEKTTVSISSFTRFSNKLDLNYVAGSASSAEILEYEQRSFDSDFFGSVFGGPQGNGINYLAPYSLGMEARNEARLGVISEAERDARLQSIAALNNRKQIEDYLLQAPITTQYNLSIAGGNERMKNNLSLLFEDSKKFFQGDQDKKYLINYNANIKLAKRLEFDFSSMMQHIDAKTNSGGNMLQTITSLAPWDMLVNEDGSLNDLSYLYYYRPNLERHVSKDLFPYSDWSYNPITDLRNRDLTTKNLSARIQAGLTFEILDGLKLSSKIQYEMLNSKSRNYFSDETFEVRQFINETSGPEWRSGLPSKQLIPFGGILEQRESNVTAYNFRNQLSYNKIFADKHAIDFVGGSELSNRLVKSVGLPNSFGYDDKTLANNQLLGDVNTWTMWNYLPAIYARLFYRFNPNSSYSFSENTSRFFSLYGNLAYTYNKKYSITGSYRTDASNIISDDPKFRYNPFWSLGLGWQLGKEEFMSDLTWLDRLNLRGTYGMNGNIDRSTSFKPLINLDSNLDPVTQQPLASISSFGNPSLRWEKTKTVNLGLDFSMFKGKLSGGIDLYRKNGFDLIVTQSISSVNGTTTQKFNNGEMLNKGVEVQLGTRMPIKNNDIVWTGSLNFAHNDNKITSFFRSTYQAYELYYGPTTSYVEGQNANSLWSFVYAGLVNVGTEANPVMKPSVYGENGDKIGIVQDPTGDALTFMENQGTTVAPTILGMRNSFKIYDFDLSFIVTAKFGHVFRRQSFNYRGFGEGGNTWVNSKYSEVANADPNEILPIPDFEPRYYYYDRYYPYLSYLTADASHIRFQEINLTYTLPLKLVRKIGLNSVNIYGQANNVGVVLFNDFGEDPEYPKETLRPQSTFTFGMQFNF